MKLWDNLHGNILCVLTLEQAVAVEIAMIRLELEVAVAVAVAG